MNEFPDNLWAPWRMEYIRSLAEECDGGCFLCQYGGRPDRDDENHVVWRDGETFVVMNRFPYTNGHLLIAPLAHKADPSDLTQSQSLGLWQQTLAATEVLRASLDPHGFNIGVNLGRCTGAGLPGHVHTHVVPRWDGDTNFMAVLGDVRVIPEALDRQYRRLVDAAVELGLRKNHGRAGP